VGIVLSTREPAQLRDGIFPLGITHTSAGSHTEPGGYTGAGQDNLHHTEHGRIIEMTEKSDQWATGQFDIADERSAADVAHSISRLGYEPVWKDWDAALTA
jgi:2-iminoacetate synthase